MPVKMMPSERRTAIQLRSPPTIAALAVPDDHACSHGQGGLVREDRRTVATDPGQGADAEEELVRAPEDQVEADAIRREHGSLHGQRRGVRRVAEPDRREHRQDRCRDDDRQEHPTDPAETTPASGFRHLSYRPSSPRGRKMIVWAAAARRMMVVTYCPM